MSCSILELLRQRILVLAPVFPGKMTRTGGSKQEFWVQGTLAEAKYSNSAVFSDDDGVNSVNLWQVTFFLKAGCKVEAIDPPDRDSPGPVHGCRPTPITTEPLVRPPRSHSRLCTAIGSIKPRVDALRKITWTTLIYANLCESRKPLVTVPLVPPTKVALGVL